MDLETYTKSCLRRLGFKANRLRGQNFLIDDNALQTMVELAAISPSDIVIEIGTGLGVLTKSLAGRAKQIHTFEIERELYPFLDSELAGLENVTLQRKSFNKYSFGELLDEIAGVLQDGKVKIVANLPYQISSLFIQTIIEYSEWISLACVMLQREVALRLAAEPGDPSYGSLTVFVQTWFEVELAAEVPPASFLPAPKVTSSIVRFAPILSDKLSTPPDSFEKLVRGLFRHRRKTALNALMRAFPHLGHEKAKAIFGLSGVDPHLRPDMLGRNELLALATAYGATMRSSLDTDGEAMETLEEASK
ncbi:MAG: ribosomal RNA small subunit methyltransferase A [bacterium]